jgi:acyl-CoA thioester hydrolase
MFVHELRVRYGECDPQGVVFNANYLLYFDTAWTELWREAIGPWQEMPERGLDAVVAHAELSFRAAARFDDVIGVHIAVDGLGRTSIASRFEVRRGDDLLIEGTIRHVMLDAKTWRPVELPDDVRAGLARYGSDSARSNVSSPPLETP